MTGVRKPVWAGRGPVAAGLAASLAVHAAVAAAVLVADLRPSVTVPTAIPVDLVVLEPAPAAAAETATGPTDAVADISPADDAQREPATATPPDPPAAETASKRPAEPAALEPVAPAPIETAEAVPSPPVSVESAVTPALPPIPALRPVRTASVPAVPGPEPTTRPASVPVRQVAAAPAGGHGASAGAGSEAAPLAGNPAPAYPYSARARGQEGRVVVRIGVTADGRAADVAVLQSSGVAALDRAASRAVKVWRFEPARRLGRPVAASLTLPIVFRLQDRQTAAR